MRQIKISDFTQDELDYFVEKCHFTGDERKVFELRSDGFRQDEIADMLHVCTKTIYRLNKRVKEKMLKVQGSSL